MAKYRKIHGILTGSAPHSSAATRNYSKTKRANFSWKPRPKRNSTEANSLWGAAKGECKKIIAPLFCTEFFGDALAG